MKNLLDRILKKGKEQGSFYSDMESAYNGDKEAQKRLDTQQVNMANEYGSDDVKKTVNDSYASKNENRYYDQLKQSGPMANKPSGTVLDKLINKFSSFTQPKGHLAPKLTTSFPMNSVGAASTNQVSQPLPANNYTVAQGDTFGNIAKMYQMTPQALQGFNPNIQDFNMIQPGQNINLGNANVNNNPMQTRTVDQIFAEQTAEQLGGGQQQMPQQILN